MTGGSVFVYDLKDDFIGGYDHGKNAGTMLAADHNINKGGKFWAWGPMNYGHEWDCKTLTDSDGAYVELMTGAYSDNQPDYCWINPHETKEFTAYWYGIRDLRHVNRGNADATVNMDIDKSGAIHIAANVTQIRPSVKSPLRAVMARSCMRKLLISLRTSRSRMTSRFLLKTWRNRLR